MSEFVHLHNHGFFSLLDGLSSPKDMIKRAIELGHKAMAITDHGTISGVIKFYLECKKNNIKPILGIETYVSDNDASIKDKENSANRHLIVLAKNLEGYYDLIRLNNEAASTFYRNSRADKETIKKIAQKGNLIGLSGCIGGVLASKLYTEIKEAYSCRTTEECEEFIRDDWLEFGINEVKEWNDIFGGNFYIEIQDSRLPTQLCVKDKLRKISEETGIPIVATCDPHFAKPEDSIVHEVLICSNTKKTLVQREEQRESGEDILFSDNSEYYIKSYDELKDRFTEEELANSVKIADSIEEYEIELKKPKIPEFKVPKGFKDVNDFVYKKCIKALKDYGIDDKEHTEKFEFEYDIFSKTEINGVCLNNYFAILWDIVQFVESIGSKCGVGRGSAAGCMTSYLLGITRLDPVEYNLSFQRFFNTGRLSKDNVSLPDIDLDVSAEVRPLVIEHLKKTWGDNNVLQIATFGTLKPKAAIKEVFRARGIDFQQANLLTKIFPDDEIKHDDEASYTIEDALEISSEFREAMEPYKAEVELAKKLEGTIKSRGVHAAGVLISSEDVNSFLPITYDARSKSFMCSFEMGDSEKFCVKVDVLGLKLLTIFDICTEKINELKDDFYVESINHICYNDNNEGEEKMTEQEEKFDGGINGNGMSNIEEGAEEEIELKDVAIRYFESKGYTSEKIDFDIGTFYRASNGERRIYYYVEENPFNIFGDREGKLDVFVNIFGRSGVNSVVFTSWKEVATIFKVDDIVSNEKEKSVKLGKIEGIEIKENNNE